jgi:hypothetical protein
MCAPMGAVEVVVLLLLISLPLVGLVLVIRMVERRRGRR